MNTAIFKFGGATTTDKQSVNRNFNIIENLKKQYDRIITVWSAPSGQTKELEAIYSKYHTDLEKLEEDIIKYLVLFWVNFGYLNIGHLAKLIESIQKDIKKVKPEMLKAYCLHLGELVATSILTEMLAQRTNVPVVALDAKNFIYTQGENPNDQDVVIPNSIKKFQENYSNIILNSGIFMLQGFYGHNDEGVTLLGWDGTDYTTVIAGKIIGLDQITLFKNFGDEEFSVETSIRLDKETNRNTVAEKCLIFAKKHKIKIEIRNIQNPTEHFIYKP